MSFILAAQRDHDPVGAFERYAAYLDSNRNRIPPSALALIDSDWYFGFEDHRAPHDSWLQDIRISESRPDDEDSPPGITIRIRLLGAYHDGVIELTYSGVVSYSLQTPDLTRGHCDWRYDEFRISEAGHLIHEIEWCGATDTGRWLIEAKEIQHSWHLLETSHH
jgi:hypothetical protein